MMRRITLLFAMLLAAVGLGTPAMAADDAYPPRALTVTLSDVSPEPGEPFDVTVNGCLAGEVIDFEFHEVATAVPCAVPRAIAGPAGDVGAATQRFIAPSEGGTYTGTVSLASTGAAIGTFEVDVATAVPASMTTSAPLEGQLDWTPGRFSLAFVVLVALSVAVAIRLRLLEE